LRDFLYRYLFWTAFAAIGYLLLFVVSFFIGKIPYDFLSSAHLFSDAAEIAIGVLVGGAAFVLNSFLNGDDQIKPGDGEVVRGALRDIARPIAALIGIAIGATGVVAAAVMVAEDIGAYNRTGLWHTLSFCQAITSLNDHLCPVASPVFSWVFNVPAFIVWLAGGAVLLRQNIKIFQE
jgi:hypothetical protein